MHNRTSTTRQQIEATLSTSTMAATSLPISTIAATSTASTISTTLTTSTTSTASAAATYISSVNTEVSITPPIRSKPPSPFLCYKSVDNRTLPSMAAENPNRGHSIFFLETSCKSKLVNKITMNVRQACSVESAALMNPNLDVYLMFASPAEIKVSDAMNDRIMNELLKYDNLKIRYLDVDKYFEGTPVEKLYKSGKSYYYIPLSI